MIKNILISLIITMVIALIFGLFRNEYTYRRRMEANKLIHEYMQSMINKLSINDYFYLLSQWDDMEYEYDEYMFNLFLWGRYSAIKPKYKALLIRAKE